MSAASPRAPPPHGQLDRGENSVSLSPIPKLRDDVGGRLHLAGFDLTFAQCQRLEQSYALLHPPASVDILRDSGGFCGAAARHQPDISRSMVTISFSTCRMSASISSSGRGGRYS